jgi:LacI family transcriptional regulator
VLEAIRELNYIPNSRARYLRRGRTETIGYYTSYGTVSIEQEFARILFDGLQAACGELNQDLLVFHATDRSPGEIARLLTSSKVDGVIHHPRHGDDELAETLRDGHKPLVRVGEPFPQVTSVVAEDWKGAARLARHLYTRGHRRVLFRMEPGNLISARRRHDGFREAAERLNMEVVTTVAQIGTDDLTEIELDYLTHFRDHGITAVACWRDESAAKVLVWCRAAGIHVPEDVAVVGFDGLTPGFCPTEFRLTTIVIDWQRIVEEAVFRLIDLIEKREVPDEICVPCSIYIGNTS